MNSIPADPALQHFHELTADEQRAAIRRMAAEGWSALGIASATRLSVEQIAAILAEPVP